jgi:hypothetical protein
MQVRVLPRAFPSPAESQMDQYDRKAIAAEEDDYYAFFGEMIRAGRIL